MLIILILALPLAGCIEYYERFPGSQGRIENNHEYFTVDDFFEDYYERFPESQGSDKFFADRERNNPHQGFNLAKGSGAYKNHHKSRKTYVGKGKEDRAKASANRVAKRHKDPYTHREVTTADSDREAFKQESRMLDEEGGPESGSKL